MATKLELANRALGIIGTRSRFASVGDISSAANGEGFYVDLFYNPLRDFLLREGDYDFSIKHAVTTTPLSGSIPWVYIYTYPTDALRIRTLIPAVYDHNDPQHIVFTIYGGTGSMAIMTQKLASAIVYTYKADEAVWDPMFAESFTRFLGSAVAYGLENAGKSKNLLDETFGFLGLEKTRFG